MYFNELQVKVNAVRNYFGSFGRLSIRTYWHIVGTIRTYTYMFIQKKISYILLLMCLMNVYGWTRDLIYLIHFVFHHDISFIF